MKPPQTGDAFEIRPARPGDEAGAYEVCLQTGDSGEDATGLYEDPLALGHIYVGPYLKLEPRFAFILADAKGICGYALAALDSKVFYDAYLSQWLPPLRAAHPEPPGRAEDWTPTQKLYREFHHACPYYPPSLQKFPSHLHIDLLPRAQGRGWGSRMMRTLLDALCDAGSPGVHLAMSARNTRAAAFYAKLGFHEIERGTRSGEPTVYFGRALAACG